MFVSCGYFEKTQDEVVSNRTMDYEEIRSDPVGVYDIQMMMQALPGVCLLYTSPSPRDLSTSRMPSSA